MILKRILPVLFFFLIDFLLSQFFFKNTSFWEQNNWKEKYWRIPSKIYNHDLMPNIRVVDTWGDLLKKELITNSLGFVDFNNRKIDKINNRKKRIILVGDSFIEGVGLNYEQTFFGILQKKLKNKYEVLNSAVSSYSPSIYYSKTNHFIKKGYVFDMAIIFLDISDVVDEMFIDIDSQDQIKNLKRDLQNKKKFKYKLYKFGHFLRDNFLTFRIFQIISDKTEIYKNYIKLKIKVAKESNSNFFSVTKNDVLFYRMRNIDRGSWTRNQKNFDEVKKGIDQSERYLIKLFKILKKNNIDSYLVIYPWPDQIYYGDKFYQKHWENFCKENDIKFVNLFSSFESNDPKNIILKNFIKGDVHWNYEGSKLIADGIISKIDF